jgi:hypothetical protein
MARGRNSASNLASFLMLTVSNVGINIVDNLLDSEVGQPVKPATD